MTEALSEELRRMLEGSGALLSGHYILSSGRHSGNYMQCARLCAVPEYCEVLAAQLAEKANQGLGEDAVDLVLAPAIGGVVIGYEMARQMKLPGLFTERDKDRVMQLRRGFKILPGERILIAEDVITTGGSVLEVEEIVNQMGAKVVGYACLFDRSKGGFQPGPPVFSIAPLDFPTYEALDCPLCAEGKTQAVKPGSRG